MGWEEFINNETLTALDIPRKLTDIECPKCKKHIWKRMDITLTSYPPQYQYECDCGWVGYHWK